jgi:Tfp pilus assembly PilM family ATPase
MSQFIKEIFLPEKIRNSYLFTKTIVGIEINKTSIIATKTRLKGITSTIELTIEEKIAENVSEENFSPTSPTLTSIFSKIGSYDEIHTTLPSSLVVFKELKLPFLTREKIAMVIGFEIEPLLPFSLRDAVIDFIITRQIPEEKSSEILVTAVQKQHIIEHIELFRAVGLEPTVITIDMIALYGLYKQVPAYNQLNGGTVIIDINPYSTCVTLMINTQLKTIRTLPKGIISIAKTAAQELQKTPAEIMEHLLRFGLEATDLASYTPAIEKAVTEWWDSINFTLTSFTAQLLNRQPVSKIIFLGEGSIIKGLIPFVTQKSGIACELFNAETIGEDKTFVVHNSNAITPLNIVSVSAALPLPTTVDYNLNKQEFSAPDNRLLIKQLVVLIVLTLTLFATLVTDYTIQVKKLNKEINSSQHEALTALQGAFKDLEDVSSLDDAIADADEELRKQKETWLAFSGPSRISFLECLRELTSKIDRRSLGFSIDQIIIAEGELTLKAQVRDHDALKILERDLAQSELFSYIEPQENPQFTMKIKLATSSEEL